MIVHDYHPEMMEQAIDWWTFNLTSSGRIGDIARRAREIWGEPAQWDRRKLELAGMFLHLLNVHGTVGYCQRDGVIEWWLLPVPENA